MLLIQLVFRSSARGPGGFVVRTFDRSVFAVHTVKKKGVACLNIPPLEC